MKNVLFSLIFALFTGSFFGCGSDDTSPNPLPDGGATDGVNPSADSDPNAPECYMNPDYITGFVAGNPPRCKYIFVVWTSGPPKSGDPIYKFAEPSAKITMKYLDYVWKTESWSLRGSFEFQECISENTILYPALITLSASKSSCKTKTIEKELYAR